jgi:hypothetical protein
MPGLVARAFGMGPRFREGDGAQCSISSAIIFTGALP